MIKWVYFSELENPNRIISEAGRVMKAIELYIIPVYQSISQYSSLHQD